jgi:decaprenylphospho-beta-D-erythro-pentofuranosid-2-ulose 2-reductase
VDTDRHKARPVRDALGSVQSVVVLGGSSEIGVAIAAELARTRHATVVLAGRRPEALAASGQALERAGAGRVETVAFDAEDTDDHEAFVDKVVGLVGDLDIVILAFGLLGDQATDEAGGDGAVLVARTNYLGPVSVGLAIARRLRQQGHGTLIVLSSVAGERVRRANFIYGASKAGLDAFAQGLGDALAGSGAGVLIVRPGFVKTKMTVGMRPPPLSTTAGAVAEATVRALERGREIVWVPGALRGLMVVVRHLPRPVFRRLKV